MSNSSQLIQSALAPYDGLFQCMTEQLTSERAFTLFKSIADISGPTTTVSYTRGPIVRALVEAAQDNGLAKESLQVDTNYRGTGNVLLSLGHQPRKPIWSMAHLDNISFLTGEYADGHYVLTPFCDPRQTKGRRLAQALTYDSARGCMVPIAHGWLCYDGSQHVFETDATDLPLATRVVYRSSADWNQESDQVTGNIDNAFGCAALVLAATVLSNWDVNSLFVLTDEEEGVVVPGPAAFSRGANRLLNRMVPDQFPALITISDHHEEVAELMDGQLDLTRFGQGALFGAFASGTKGGVTPPRLLAHQREMADYLSAQNIRLTENGGYLSRSDCVTAMLATPNVSLIGYPAAYSHFIETPRAHINDLVNLAKTLVVVHLLAQDGAWRQAALGEVGT